VQCPACEGRALFLCGPRSRVRLLWWAPPRLSRYARKTKPHGAPASLRARRRRAVATRRSAARLAFSADLSALSLPRARFGRLHSPCVSFRLFLHFSLCARCRPLRGPPRKRNAKKVPPFEKETKKIFCSLLHNIVAFYLLNLTIL